MLPGPRCSNADRAKRKDLSGRAQVRKYGSKQGRQQLASCRYGTSAYSLHCLRLEAVQGEEAQVFPMNPCQGLVFRADPRVAAQYRGVCVTSRVGNRFSEDGCTTTAKSGRLTICDRTRETFLVTYFQCICRSVTQNLACARTAKQQNLSLSWKARCSACLVTETHHGLARLQ